MDKKIPNILPKQSYWMDQRLLTVRHNEFAWRATPPDTMEEWEEQPAGVGGRPVADAGNA